MSGRPETNRRVKAGAIRAMLLAVALFALFLGGGTANAQLLYGTLTGTVTDQSGAAIVNATVMATETSTNVSKTTTTNEAGLYSIINLNPGTYEVSIVSTQNFAKFEEGGILLTANSERRVDAALKPANLQQSVTVTTAPPELQTERADVVAEISADQVSELPSYSTVGRNVTAILLIIPGSTPPAENASYMTNPERAMDSYVNGLNTDGNTFRLDGAVDLYPSNPNNSGAYIPPEDAIESVNVVTANYEASQGSVGGAAVNFTIKSGTNHLHGTAYEYNTITDYNARNWFQTPAVLPELPKYIFNQYGATGGGPILKNKLFYFGSWEGTRIRKFLSGTTSVPSAALRAGDFSADPNPIYNPATGNPTTGQGKTAFAGNQIPVSAAAAALMATVGKVMEPLPNENQTSQLNNYFGGLDYDYNEDLFDVKINYAPTEKTNFFGHYGIGKNTIVDPPKFGLSGTSWDSSSPGIGTPATWNIGLGATHVVNSHLYFDSAAGFTHQRFGVLDTDVSLGDYGLNVLGIPGTNNVALGLFGAGIPGFVIGSNYASLGNSFGANPNLTRVPQLTANVNATYISGKHTYRAGFEFIHIGLNVTQPYGSGSFNGVFNFSGNATTLYGGTPNDYNALADFELGLPSVMSKGAESESPTTARWTTYSAYGQDTWQIRQNLTLTYGVRYEIYPVPYGDHFGLISYDPAVQTTVTDATGTHNVGEVLIGGENGIPRRAYEQNGHGQTVPRVGLDYRLDNKTVVRSGYGITVDPDPLRNLTTTVYPNSINLAVNAPNGYTPAGSFTTGIPPLTPGNYRLGYLPLPYNVATQTLPQNFRRGYIQSWNLAVQREFPASLVANVAYIGNHQVREITLNDMNAAPPGGGNAGRLLNAEYGTVADPNFNNTEIDSWDPLGSSYYHSLQAQLTRRTPTYGSFGLIYTKSRAVDMNDGNLTGYTFAYPTYFARNKGLASYDRTNNFQWWTIEPLPFGKDQYLLQHGVGAAVLGGWQLQSVLSWVSGTPFTVTSSGSLLNAPGSTQVANQLVAHPHILGGHGVGHPYFNTADFSVPTTVAFGTGGRNNVRGPGFFNLNAGIKRTIPLNDRFAVQLQAEAFDLTNTPQFANPAATVSSPGSFGIITTSNTQRSLRFMGRVTF